MNTTSKEWAAKALEMTDEQINWALEDIKATMYLWKYDEIDPRYSDRLNAERDSLLTEWSHRRIARGQVMLNGPIR